MDYTRRITGKHIIPRPISSKHDASIEPIITPTVTPTTETPTTPIVTTSETVTPTTPTETLIVTPITPIVTPITETPITPIVTPITPIRTPDQVFTTQPQPMKKATIIWKHQSLLLDKYEAGPNMLTEDNVDNILDIIDKKMYIKVDGVYNLQVLGKGCDVRIECHNAFMGSPIKSPVVLAANYEFANATCFCKKGDGVAMFATPKTTSQVAFNPKTEHVSVMQLHPCLSDMDAHVVVMSLTVL